MSIIKKAALFATLSVVCVGQAAGLDANDIAHLVKNGVQDAVIINMVRSNRLPAPLSPQDVLLLNANGASPTLLEFLTRPDSSVAVVSSSPPVAYAEPSTPVVVTGNACSPTYIARPTYVAPRYYSAPTYVYPYSSYDYYRYRPNSFNFYYGRGWGGGHRRPYGGYWGHRPPRPYRR